MLLESEIMTLSRVGSMPAAEAWRKRLKQAKQQLHRWIPSADTFGLWVSDYGKIRRSLNELNAQIEHLSWMLGAEETRGADEQSGLKRAIDHAVHRIGELAGAIDAELRDSAVAGGR